MAENRRCPATAGVILPKRKAPVVDEEMKTASSLEYFARVADPRIERSQLHPLASILVLSVCAVIARNASTILRQLVL
jgi:DDE_Tnp_1-associated